MSVKKPANQPATDSAASAQSDPARVAARLDRVAGWLLVALTLALYLRTGARDLLAGDPGEFQVAAWTFGLAHATGYPLYLLTGGLWQRLLGIGGISPAYALNLLSGFTMAAAVGVLYMAALRALPGTPGVRRAAAMVAAAWFATMPTVWSQALIAEVYALQALLLAALIWMVAGWDADRDARSEQEAAESRESGVESA
ncbi:MAG: protein O-mannosyl-transferase family, partial [Caldilineaceae bacterium]